MAFSCCCWFAFVFTCHTSPRGDTMLSSLLIRFRWLWTDQLITGRAVFGLCLVCLCFCSCFLFVVLCWLCALARWQLNGLCIDPCAWFPSPLKASDSCMFSSGHSQTCQELQKSSAMALYEAFASLAWSPFWKRLNLSEKSLLRKGCGCMCKVLFLSEPVAFRRNGKL